MIYYDMPLRAGAILENDIVKSKNAREAVNSEREAAFMEAVGAAEGDVKD